MNRISEGKNQRTYRVRTIVQVLTAGIANLDIGWLSDWSLAQMRRRGTNKV